MKNVELLPTVWFLRIRLLPALVMTPCVSPNINGAYLPEFGGTALAHAADSTACQPAPPVAAIAAEPPQKP